MCLAPSCSKAGGLYQKSHFAINVIDPCHFHFYLNFLYFINCRLKPWSTAALSDALDEAPSDTAEVQMRTEDWVEMRSLGFSTSTTELLRWCTRSATCYHWAGTNGTFWFCCMRLSHLLFSSWLCGECTCVCNMEPTYEAFPHFVHIVRHELPSWTSAFADKVRKLGAIMGFSRELKNLLIEIIASNVLPLMIDSSKMFYFPVVTLFLARPTLLCSCIFQ